MKVITYDIEVEGSDKKLRLEQEFDVETITEKWLESAAMEMVRDFETRTGSSVRYYAWKAEPVIQTLCLTYNIYVNDKKYRYIVYCDSEETILEELPASAGKHFTLNQCLLPNVKDAQETVDRFFKLLMLQS